MLENTTFFALFSIIIVAILLWRIQPDAFRKSPWWHFCLASAIFWGCLSLILMLTAWDYFYSYFTLPNYRLIAPLAALGIYPLWSLAIRWIAFRLPTHPVLGFCLLGGLQGLFEHAVAIYWLDLLTVPFLADSTPLGVFVLAFFEYVLYWSLVVTLIVLVGRIQNHFWPATNANSSPIIK